MSKSFPLILDSQAYTLAIGLSQIGLPVSSLDEIPEGMIGITIEETIYQKIVSKGKMPEAVVNTWLEIWADKELDSKRAYRADFYSSR